MAKIGRNHPCPCKSGRKYKHCCLFMRHGGERIISKLQTGTDLDKEIMGKLIKAGYEKRMKEIIRRKINVTSD